MKYEDLLTFSNVFASEFNNSSLHDRVLVFEIIVEEETESEEETDNHDDNLDDNDVDNNDQDDRDDTNSVGGEQPSEKEIEFKEAEKENDDDNDDNDDDDDNDDKVGGGERKQSEEENDNVDNNNDDRMGRVGGKQAEEENGTKGKQEVEEEQPSRPQIEESENSKSSDEKSVEAQTKKHKIFVHSCWLAVQSPYFRALFYSGMKESFSKEVVMKIGENELEAHLTLIEAMYCMEVLDDKDYSLVLQVLVLANMYDVALVFKKCNYVLMSTSLTLESCEGILQTVKDLPGCTDLQSVLEKFLVKEFTPFDQTWILDKFISLSEASLRLLLSSNHLPVQFENTIFVALMKWIDVNLKLKRYSLAWSTLLQLVRFELMTIDFLCDVVCHHAVAKMMQGFNNFLQKGLAYHGISMARKQQMENKPVQRPSCLDKVHTFSWIIDKDEREKLSDSSRIQSCPYWFQGYQIQLDLHYNSDSNSFGLYLCILNIMKESYLNISWTAQSDLFKCRSITMNELFTSRSGWGRPKVENGIIGLFDVSEAVSHTIDVTVKFN